MSLGEDRENKKYELELARRERAREDRERAQRDFEQRHSLAKAETTEPEITPPALVDLHEPGVQTGPEAGRLHQELNQAPDQGPGTPGTEGGDPEDRQFQAAVSTFLTERHAARHDLENARAELRTALEAAIEQLPGRDLPAERSVALDQIADTVVLKSVWLHRVNAAESLEEAAETKFIVAIQELFGIRSDDEAVQYARFATDSFNKV